MAIRKILVPLFGQSGGASDDVNLASLRAGLRIGQLLRCHVETCCIAAKLPPSGHGIFEGLSGSAITPLIDEIERRNRECFWHARALFDQAVEEFCPARAEEPSGRTGFTASFLELSGEIGEISTERGQLADLIVLATNAESFTGGYRQNFHVLLTQTGRPVCLAPVMDGEISIEHAAIAWNGTAEATRAVAVLLSLLRGAKAVTLLSVSEHGSPEVDTCAFAQYLRWHGLEAEVREVEHDERGVGLALQEEALKAGADFMIMGGYTRGPVKRFVFGGASGAIARAPQLPVIMVD